MNQDWIVLKKNTPINDQLFVQHAAKHIQTNHNIKTFTLTYPITCEYTVAYVAVVLAFNVNCVYSVVNSTHYRRLSQGTSL